jgi:hypothetical protein
MMTDDTRRPLFLHEEILLLALRDREGTPEFGAWYQQAMAGAILAELLLRERVEVEEAKKKLVHVKSTEPLGDPIVDECLEHIRDAAKPRTAQDWVGRIAGMRDLKERVARGLCDRGILRMDEKHVLLIFSRKVYPEIDHAPEREIIDRLRAAIFDDSAPIDARTMVLVSVAHTTGILPAAFEKKELAAQKTRLEQIRSGDVAASATAGAVDAALAAVMVAMMAAVIVPAVIN